MKKTIIICTMLLTFVAQAQTFEWFKTPAVSFDANASLIGYPNTVDASNNIYVTGFQDNRFLYGDVFGHMFLHKYNAAGDLLFSKTIEGHVQVYNIKTDTQGHVLLLAGYVNQIKIGNWELNTVAQGIQPILLKFDPLGNFLWHLPLNTIDPFINHAEALVVDQITNDYYVAFDNFDDAYIQKISSDGNVVSTIAQTDTNRITSLSIDSEQNIYAAGSCASANATFAGVVTPTNLPYNTYVVKYNPTGVFQWVKYVEDITCTTPMVVAHTPDAVYFCSYLFGAYAFDNLIAEGPASNAFGDFFLTKLTANGAFQWVREVPGNNFGVVNLGNRNFLALDAMGKIYVSGSTSRTIQWNNNLISDIPGNSGDAVILQYEPDGTLQQIITGGGAWEDRVDGVSIDSNGSIYASGMGYGETNFGAFSHSASAYFPYLTKVNSALNTHSNITKETFMYPNPAKDLLYFHNMKSTQGTIYNMLGQTVMEFTVKSDLPISVSALPAGTYIVALNGLKAQRLLKE